VAKDALRRNQREQYLPNNTSPASMANPDRDRRQAAEFAPASAAAPIYAACGLETVSKLSIGVFLRRTAPIFVGLSRRIHVDTACFDRLDGLVRRGESA
jgi:hypothetical protein